MTWSTRTLGTRVAMVIGALLVCAVVTTPSALSAKKKGRSAQASACTGTTVRPLDTTPAEVREATLCLINSERRERGLPVLRLNDRLGTAATRHSRQMVANGFFSHVSPGGTTLTTRVRRTAYLNGTNGWSLGENLAWGARKRADAQSIVNAWMNSPGHRANILNRQFREIGIGIASGTPTGIQDGATYTTDFGRRS